MRFTNIEQIRNKRSTEAASSSDPRTPGMSGAAGVGGIAAEAVEIQTDGRMRVTMNGVVAVTDIWTNFRGMGLTSTGWRPHSCLSAT